MSKYIFGLQMSDDWPKLMFFLYHLYYVEDVWRAAGHEYNGEILGYLFLGRPMLTGGHECTCLAQTS